MKAMLKSGAYAAPIMLSATIIVERVAAASPIPAPHIPLQRGASIAAGTGYALFIHRPAGPSRTFVYQVTVFLMGVSSNFNPATIILQELAPGNKFDYIAGFFVDSNGNGSRGSIVASTPIIALARILVYHQSDLDLYGNPLPGAVPLFFSDPVAPFEA